MKSSVREAGNILFLILLAVILFAALSYAVTSSIRGGGKNAQSEVYKLEATKLINYVIAAKAQILRMRMVDGISENNFGFSAYGLYEQFNCPSNVNESKCQFLNQYDYTYRRSGGADRLILKREAFNLGNSNALYLADNIYSSNAYLTNNFSYTARVKGVGLDDKAELVLVVHGLNTEFCKAINETLGLGNVTYNLAGVAAATYGNTSAPNTSFPEPSGTSKYGENEPALYGQEMFCYIDAGFYSGQWGMFMAVLIPR